MILTLLGGSLLAWAATTTGSAIASTVVAGTCVGLAAKGIYDKREAEELIARADERISEHKKEFESTVELENDARKAFLKEQEANIGEMENIYESISKLRESA